MSAARSAIFYFITSIFLLILAPSGSWAKPIPPSNLPILNQPLVLNGAEANQQWLNLLQFRPSGWNNRLRSEVDSPDFFLSGTGKNDPQAELIATIEQLSKKPSLQCRFPARAQWLHQQGLLKNLKITSAYCPDLHKWLKQFKAESISLIFPAAYLNSPSSMFGHTFLRVNQHNQTDTGQLLAQTINFAANVNHDDPEFLFAYKGLFGGYPGVVTVKPYYEKAKEYSEIENRDKVEQLILDTLQKVADDGVSQQQIDSVLHQLELSQREVGGDGYPYGLQIILSAISACSHSVSYTHLTLPTIYSV